MKKKRELLLSKEKDYNSILAEGAIIDIGTTSIDIELTSKKDFKRGE